MPEPASCPRLAMNRSRILLWQPAASTSRPSKYDGNSIRSHTPPVLSVKWTRASNFHIRGQNLQTVPYLPPVQWPWLVRIIPDHANLHILIQAVCCETQLATALHQRRRENWYGIQHGALRGHSSWQRKLRCRARPLVSNGSVRNKLPSSGPLQHGTTCPSALVLMHIDLPLLQGCPPALRFVPIAEY